MTEYNHSLSTRRFDIYKGDELVGEAVRLGDDYMAMFYKNIRAPSVNLTSNEIKRRKLKLIPRESK